MQPNIVILAGGISSRMRLAQARSAPLDPALRRDAEEKAKTMIGVGSDRRPFLDYLLLNVVAAGYRNVVILIGERDHSIRDYYEARKNAPPFQKLNIKYAVQPLPAGRQKPLGTADALWHALRATPEWRGQSFTVCNSDNLYSAEALLWARENKHHNAMIDYDRAALQFAPERIAAFAVIKKNATGYLVDIIEKPSVEEMDSVAEANGRVGVSMNIFRLAYDQILPCLEAVPLHPVRQEKELPAAVKMLVQQNPHAVFAIPRAEHVPDLTVQSDILLVKDYVQKNFQNFQAFFPTTEVKNSDF
ncbi:MAG: hypothetical protein ALAOOOJD_00064 [bacterium]|nr:hypothetical protein [bacterium]